MNFESYGRIDDVIVGSREKAKEILVKLYEIAEMYGAVSVRDLYDICNLTSTYADSKKYWYGSTIKDAYMVQVKEGYRIHTPSYVDENDPSHEQYYTKVYDRTYDKPDSETSAEPLNVTIHTNEVDDADATLAEMFKYIHTIKDRMVNLTIM